MKTLLIVLFTFSLVAPAFGNGRHRHDRRPLPRYDYPRHHYGHHDRHHYSYRKHHHYHVPPRIVIIPPRVRHYRYYWYDPCPPVRTYRSWRWFY